MVSPTDISNHNNALYYIESIKFLYYLVRFGDKRFRLKIFLLCEFIQNDDISVFFFVKKLFPPRKELELLFGDVHYTRSINFEVLNLMESWRTAERFCRRYTPRVYIWIVLEEQDDLQSGSTSIWLHTCMEEPSVIGFCTNIHAESILSH